jgi:hypothetical protein
VFSGEYMGVVMMIDLQSERSFQPGFPEQPFSFPNVGIPSNYGQFARFCGL